jgi:hypothetical protein
MRNTLIVDLTNGSNQVDFQRLHKDTLAGMGPVLVFLREAQIRSGRQHLHLRERHHQGLGNRLIIQEASEVDNEGAIECHQRAWVGC